MVTAEKERKPKSAINTMAELDAVLEIIDESEAFKARRSVSFWAERNRALKTGLWQFTDYPFLRPMHDAFTTHDKIVGCKAAQMGYTETLLNIAFFTLGNALGDVMYILPTVNDAGDFSAGRFNPAIELSPVLENLFTDVHNVGHKRAGQMNLYVRGSNSRSGLKSVPITALLIDEYDEMNQENIPLARERLSGAKRKFEANVSTPTIPGFGIWEEWLASSQHRWYARCPHCAKKQHLTFDGNVEWREGHSETARFKCALCGKPWSSEAKLKGIQDGELVQETSSGDAWGLHVSQLYSPTISAVELAKAYSEENETKRTEFYNSKLGLPYVAADARLTTAHIKACITSEFKAKVSSSFATMGVDVSSVGEHYYEIAEWPRSGSRFGSLGKQKRIIAVGRASVPGLHVLMEQYKIQLCIIDAQPERKLARDFCSAFPGRVYAAFYTEGMTKVFIRDRKERVIKMHRTESIDNVISSVKTRNTVIPANLPNLSKYIEHLKNVVRVVKVDTMGRPIARYINVGPDHYLHAANYNGLAGAIGGTPQTGASADGGWAKDVKQDDTLGIGMPDDFYEMAVKE